MKTIEEKAFSYSQSHPIGLSLPEKLMKAYLAGASEALAGQWRDPGVELPVDCTKVLIHIRYNRSSNGRLMYGVEEFWYEKDDGFDAEEARNREINLKIIAWMPIPALPQNIKKV